MLSYEANEPRSSRGDWVGCEKGGKAHTSAQDDWLCVSLSESVNECCVLLCVSVVCVCVEVSVKRRKGHKKKGVGKTASFCFLPYYSKLR